MRTPMKATPLLHDKEDAIGIPAFNRPGNRNGTDTESLTGFKEGVRPRLKNTCLISTAPEDA